MQNNEIKIKGRSYRYKEFTTKNGKLITRFGLQFYNGKDFDGNSKYAFVDCKAFKSYGLVDKQDVTVIGTLSSEDWVDKEGNKKSNFVIIVDNVITEQVDDKVK